MRCMHESSSYTESSSRLSYPIRDRLTDSRDLAKYVDVLQVRDDFETSSGSKWCEPCQRRFSSRQAVMQHLRASSSHDFYPNTDTRAEEPLSVHLEHRREPHVEPRILTVDDCRYAGLPKALVAPVLSFACRSRFGQPNADKIIQRTKAPLDREMDSALIEAASRLLLPDNSPKGVVARQEEQREKIQRALSAEAAFLENSIKFGHQFPGNLNIKS